MGSGPSRLEFREKINRLLKETIPATETDFWKGLFDFQSNPEFIYGLITPEDARALVTTQTDNFRTLITQILEILEKAVDARSTTHLTGGRVLNAIRFLTRVFSVCHEEAIRSSADKVFWTEQDAVTGSDEEDTRPFAERIIDTFMDLLFLRNYTIHPGNFNPVDTDHILWYAGIKIDSVMSAPSGIESNRMETLKCMIACFSGSIFHSPEEQVHYSDKWLEYATNLETENASQFLYSLVNCIISYDPIGWGVPYSSLLVGDDVEPVLDTATQLLAIFLDYRSASETQANHEPIPSTSTPTNADRPKVYLNIYRKLLSELNDRSAFQKIYRKLVFLLSNPVVSSNTYLPNSMKAIDCYQELLILFWKFCEINNNFLHYILNYENINDFVVPCLYYLSENRKDSARIGLIHVGVFCMLMLSGERQFAVQLNHSYEQRLSMNIPVFYGTHADLLILVLHRLIVDGHNRLNLLFDCFLTIITNISPYLKSLSMVTSVKLATLFEFLAAPKFIYANQQNYRHVFYLVETFNNIIQYQSEGNPHLIYAIICRQQAFKDLASVPLEAPVIRKKKSRANLLTSTNSEASLSPSQTTTTSMDGETPESPAAASSSSDQNEFTPTLEWIESWKQKLPMQTILRMIEVLHPVIESFCTTSDDGGNEAKVLDLIKKTTLVGLLPVPHPILSRKYRSHDPINIWFSSFLWGVIYIRNQNPPIFDCTKIKLFTVNIIESD